MFDVNTVAKLAALDGQVFLDETEDTYCVWRAEYHKRTLLPITWTCSGVASDKALGSAGRSCTAQRCLYRGGADRRGSPRPGFGDIRVYGDCRAAPVRGRSEQRVYFLRCEATPEMAE